MTKKEIDTKLEIAEILVKHLDCEISNALSPIYDYLQKKLIIQRVSNHRDLLLNFLDWYNEDAEKTPITEDEIDLFIKEKVINDAIEDLDLKQ